MLLHLKSDNYKKAKNHKENIRLMLTNTQNGCRLDADCKQNKMCWFQIVNLLFKSRNSATFDTKVAEFFIENKWVRNSI